MKKTGVCPKCGGADIVRVPGGVRSTMDNTQNFVIRGFQSAPVDRYICCACGFSEEWFPIYSISVSCITLLCDGICSDGFQKRRYTKENAGICDLCKTTESGGASGHVCDGWGLMGNRYG